MRVSFPSTPVAEGRPSATLFRSELVTVGRFWCAPSHPQFRTIGDIDRHTFVFPETAVWIAHDGKPKFLGSPARVTFYNPGQSYTRTACDAAGDRCTWFETAETLTRDVVRTRDRASADADHVLRFTFAPVDSATCLKARRLFRLVADGRVRDALLVEESIVSLFGQVITNTYDHYECSTRRAGLTPRQHDIVEEISSVLYRTCTENHSLIDLARGVDLSVFHLCRLFRRATGMTMHAYRHQVRIARALDALGTPDIDLLGLAVDLGYCSHSHFTRVFRRELGVVPSRVRTQLSKPGPGA